METSNWNKQEEEKWGRLIVGPTHMAGIYRSPISIPTKYHRVVLGPTSSKEAFGCRCNRFVDKYEIRSKFNKEASPGQYNIYHTPDSGQVHSERGSLGFASATERPTYERRDNPSLGPGAYETPEKKLNNAKYFHGEGRNPHEEGVLKIPFNEKNPLNYIKPITLNIYIKPGVPGPGEYDVKLSNKGHPSIGTRACRSVFQSDTKRNEYLKKKGLDPISGETYIAPSAFEEARGGGKLRSIIKNKDYLNNSGLESLEEKEMLNISFIKSEGRGEIINYDAMPKVQVRNMMKKRIEEEERHMREREEDKKNNYGNPSSSFCIEDTNRFGLPIRPKKPFEPNPGPGFYNPKRAVYNRLVTGRAVFASKSMRMKGERRPCPGPAFYAPTHQSSRISFLLNVRRKWL